MVNTRGQALAAGRWTTPSSRASGTFGYGYEFAELVRHQLPRHLLVQGHHAATPRFGNPTPRIAECAGRHAQRRRPAEPRRGRGHTPRSCPGCRQVLSQKSHGQCQRLFGGGIRRDLRRSLTRSEQVGWLEVNISCPNVHGGGMGFGTDARAAADVTRAVKGGRRKSPSIVKLSPNVTDIAAIAKRLRGRGRGRAVPHQHPAGHAHRPAHAARPCSPTRIGGLSGPCDLPGGACGWSGRSTRPSTSPSSAWAASARAEDVAGDDAGRRDGRGGRRGESRKPLRLPRHRPTALPAGHGTVRHTKI